MKKIKILLSLAFVFLLVGCTKNTSEIVFFKIGQADSALLSINDKIILIDTGETDDAREIIDYIKGQKINKIDYLLISHYDKDHIGGATEIIKELDVGVVYGPDYEETSAIYNDFAKTVVAKNVDFVKLNENKTLTDINCEIFVSDDVTYQADIENNMSLIFRLMDNKMKYLFLGDIESERITKILDDDWTATLVKIPHHGKLENSSKSLIDNIEPQIAIITSSDKNPEDQELMNILSDNNITTFVTRNGNIYCSSDGITIDCKQ